MMRKNSGLGALQTEHEILDRHGRLAAIQEAVKLVNPVELVHRCAAGSSSWGPEASAKAVPRYLAPILELEQEYVMGYHR